MTPNKYDCVFYSQSKKSEPCNIKGDAICDKCTFFKTAEMRKQSDKKWFERIKSLPAKKRDAIFSLYQYSEKKYKELAQKTEEENDDNGSNQPAEH